MTFTVVIGCDSEKRLIQQTYNLPTDQTFESMDALVCQKSQEILGKYGKLPRVSGCCAGTHGRPGLSNIMTSITYGLQIIKPVKSIEYAV